jgi:hypothetical protein
VEGLQRQLVNRETTDGVLTGKPTFAGEQTHLGRGQMTSNPVPQLAFSLRKRLLMEDLMEARSYRRVSAVLIREGLP